MAGLKNAWTVFLDQFQGQAYRSIYIDRVSLADFTGFMDGVFDGIQSITYLRVQVSASQWHSRKRVWDEEWDIKNGGPSPEIGRQLESYHIWFCKDTDGRIAYKPFMLNNVALSRLPHGLATATDTTVSRECHPEDDETMGGVLYDDSVRVSANPNSTGFRSAQAFNMLPLSSRESLPTNNFSIHPSSSVADPYAQTTQGTVQSIRSFGQPISTDFPQLEPNTAGRRTSSQDVSPSTPQSSMASYGSMQIGPLGSPNSQYDPAATNHPRLQPRSPVDYFMNRSKPDGQETESRGSLRALQPRPSPREAPDELNVPAFDRSH